MAALFRPQSTTACLRSTFASGRVFSPIVTKATFSRPARSGTKDGTPRTPQEEQQIARLRQAGFSFKQIAEFSSGKPWTPEEEQQLVRLRREGKTHSQIAQAVGRHSYSTATPSPPAATPAPPSPPPAASDAFLTWDRFFQLRRNRRWVNLGCSVVTAGAAVWIFAPLLAQQDFDAWAAQMSGLDPVIVLGISSFGIAAAGWLLGPTLGNGGFRIWAARKGWRTEIAAKEKSFYTRIKKYRADASSSSPQNPIPDYYGEKIASVKDYRRWLKDQRAFNLKKNKNMI